MQKIIPSLWFEDKCAEAIDYYVETFNTNPNKKAESKVVSVQKYPEGIPNPPWGEHMSGKVITEIFELEGQRFMALDGGPGVFAKSGQVSMTVDCSDQAEVDHFWNRLTAGGDPKAQQCGWLQDKYGFSWQIVPKQLGELLSSPDKEKSNRAMQAMLQMKKLDIAALEKAYNGQ